jgi:hypothetical protein
VKPFCTDTLWKDDPPLYPEQVHILQNWALNLAIISLLRTEFAALP